MKGEIVFDIETQNTFAEVGNDMKKFKVSVVSIYEYDTDKYTSFKETELLKLWPYLEKASRLIGYNSDHFDLPILNNYYPGDLMQFPSLDIMKVVYGTLGRRLKLDDIVKATLDESKSANGLQAIQWWKEGKIDEIIKYCEQDVRVTKNVYDFGLKHKQLFYPSLSKEMLPFSVNFEMDEGQINKNGEKNINLTLPI